MKLTRSRTENFTNPHPTAMFPILLPLNLPKGAFRTNNTTTIAKIVTYYAVVFLLCPPHLLRCGPFFERIVIPRRWCLHEVHRDSKSHQMALGQTAGCPRVNRVKKFMCSHRDTGNINYSLWLTRRLFQGCPNIQKVYVFTKFMCLFLALYAYYF